MRILKNRIALTLVLILGATYLWEFHVKPHTGPLYLLAVAEYKKQNYNRSLELVSEAYRIDPNDTAILRLIGWNHLKLGRTSEALPLFSRALRLNPDLDDARA